VAFFGFLTGLGLPGTVPTIVVGAGLSVFVGIADAKEMMEFDFGGLAGLFALAWFGLFALIGHKLREEYEQRS
jgi:hypothetical protein